MGEVVFQDEAGEEHVVPIGPERPVISVGRSTDCTIRSNRKSVSRHHAEFRFENGAVEVVDLDSSNGTWVMVEGERQPVDDPRELSHNDEIWCGDFILYYFGDDEGLVQQSSPRVEPDFEPPPDEEAAGSPPKERSEDYEKLQDEYRELEQRCESLVDELASSEQKLEEAIADNRALEEDIEALSEAIEGAEKLEEQLDSSRQRVAELEEQLEDARRSTDSQADQGPLTDDDRAVLSALLASLDRADLTELETVDRIRLQKALRGVRDTDIEQKL